MPKAKLGTKKKPTIVPRERKASGHQKQDTSAETGSLAPTLIKRLMDDVIPKAKDRRMGTVLGVMRFHGILSDAEVEAGFRYAEDVGAYEKIKGHPRRHSASPSFEYGRKGVDGLDLENLRRMDPDVADKIERRIKKQGKDIQKRYDRAQAQIPHFPILISTLVEEVCCNDQPIHSLHHPMLKKILRNLAERCYPDIIKPGDTENARKKATSRKADAALIAQAAVDALEQWFTGRDATVAFYKLHAENPHQQVGISGFGTTGHGQSLMHAIPINRSRLLVAEINAQLVRAAEAKHWREAAKESPPVEVSIEAVRAGITKPKQENAT